MKRFYVRSLILVFALSMLAPKASNGQAAIIALIFGDQVASEKFNISLELGWNLSDYARLDNTRRGVGLNFGIAGNIQLSEEWYLSPTVFFVSRRKYRFQEYSLNTGNPNLDNEYINKDGFADINYIDIPILTYYQMGHWRVGAGPQVSFLSSSDLVFEGDEGSFRQDVTSQTNDLDYGAIVALSYELGKARKGKGIFLQVRYYQGFNDVYKDSLMMGNNTGNYVSFHFILPFITDELAKKKLEEENRMDSPY